MPLFSTWTPEAQEATRQHFFGVHASCQANSVTFIELTLVDMGKRELCYEMGNAVCLVDGCPNGIVHANVGLVTIGSPDLLRLDRGHNQAKSDQRVI
jgi:hypothetical protein